MHTRKIHLLGKAQPFLKKLLRFARESHNDVRRNRNARHRCLDLTDQSCKFLGIIVAVHRL